MKRTNQYFCVFCILFALLVVPLFIEILKSFDTFDEGFTPRIRASVRPHIRRVQQWPVAVASTFNQDNLVRWLRRWRIW